MRYLALDFETGNASPLSACALGASVFEDNQLVDEKISLIRPPECVGRFHWGNVRVNHIKEKMVADAPSFAEVWEPLADIAEGSVIVCHNAMFDTNVLCSCLAHYGLKMPECRYLCTVKVSKRVWPELENHKLDTVSAAALRRTGSADADALAEKIGMRLGRISSMGKTPCSIAGDPKPREHRRTARPRNTVKRKGENKV